MIDIMLARNIFAPVMSLALLGGAVSLPQASADGGDAFDAAVCEFLGFGTATAGVGAAANGAKALAGGLSYAGFLIATGCVFKHVVIDSEVVQSEEDAREIEAAAEKYSKMSPQDRAAAFGIRCEKPITIWDPTGEIGRAGSDGSEESEYVCKKDRD